MSHVSMPAVRTTIALALAAALVASPMLAGRAEAKITGKERRLASIVNRARESRGLGPLKLNGKMTRKAHRHSVTMASHRTIFHSSCLTCHSPKPTMHAMGENVARAGGLKAAHRNLMRSSSHRNNILCSCYKAMGIGVVKRGGKVYVTQIFWG